MGQEAAQEVKGVCGAREWGEEESASERLGGRPFARRAAGGGAPRDPRRRDARSVGCSRKGAVMGF